MITEKRFLTFQDYALQIQTEDLFQILGERKDIGTNWNLLSERTKAILIDAEQTAQEEMCSYIRNRYIVEEIFAPTQTWNSGSTYFGKNLIEYSESKYNTGTTYNQGDRLSYCGGIYEVIATGTTSGVTPSITAATTYNYIVANNSYFYAKLPCQEFSPVVNYTTGTLVWYQDNIYQAVQNVNGISPAQSQNLELRYGIPSAQSYMGYYLNGNGEFNYPNILPTVNTQNWTLYNGPVSSWFTGSTYYFSGITPDNSTYWVYGENRNPQIKLRLIDIILYHLVSRLNPRNISELRNIRYDGNNAFQSGGAIGWLKGIEQGKINLNCPEKIPAVGNNIRFGSYPKNSNFY